MFTVVLSKKKLAAEHCLGSIIIIIIIYFLILKLHMVLFKLEMIQANTKLFFTEKRNHTNKSNIIKLP